MTDEPASDPRITWTTSVDAERLRACERDVARAMILQNARAAHRWDPAKRVRTRAFESVLTRTGLVLTALGATVSAIAFVMRWTRNDELNVGALLGAFVFAALALVFFRVPQLRQAAVQRVDGQLTRQAAALLDAIRSRIPADAISQLEGNMCRVRWMQGDDEVASNTFDLARSRYGLVGDVSVVLFESARSLRPVALLFAEDQVARDALSAALGERGGKLEVIDEGLVPRTTLQRDLTAADRSL